MSDQAVKLFFGDCKISCKETVRGKKKKPHTLHIHQDFLEDSFKYLNCVSSDPTN